MEDTPHNCCVLYDWKDNETEVVIECKFRTIMYFIMIYLIGNICIPVFWDILHKILSNTV